MLDFARCKSFSVHGVRLPGHAPYALIELSLPGGSVIALLLWLYRRRNLEILPGVSIEVILSLSILGRAASVGGTRQ